MKRMLVTLLACTMAVLTGCSAGGSQEVTSVDSVSTAGSEAAGEAQSKAAQEAPEVTLAETVVYDENEIRITATGLNETGILGPELSFLIENNSQQNIVVQPDYCVVNGYMMTGFMSSDVAAGKKSNDTFDFLNSTLQECNIEQIADIRLRFTVSDGDTYQTLYRTDEIILRTSAEDSYTQMYDDSGEEVYNSNGLRVVAKGAGNEFLGKGVIFYLENTTDHPVTVCAENISVNGFMMTDLFYSDLAPQSHAVDSLTLLESELEDNAIDSIKEVELSLRVIDPDSFTTVDSTEPITLYF